MTGLQGHETACPTSAPSAVAWIDGREAIVAAISRQGGVSTCEITRGWLTGRGYLSQVVRVIGDRQRVTILGPSSYRLALERAYVATFHRCDRVIDVQPAGPIGVEELVDRARALAA